ncbi:1,2-Dihydroxy-3-keto-5-methylthiopentene dioxygenase [Trypanosoma grayi]|uniref:1,2-Dihydroxy-3-keto-5-methylthiopentene dioxygenase n=1 Tax=Trypanosoma grayi TaxID=71804 RepID=UPI0004F44134|nr:1,2-Dihydroxy-3-keto-5-methylthiopentene dioxygenase [Trypanosoma grayi]KEG13474.1 1,2-Dihydroxy-3-keto-5-methylthiopentene dioxygenase [Trypanosoma grayi]
MLAAWLLNTHEANIAAPNHVSPDAPVSIGQLEAWGVYTRRMDPATLHERHPKDEENRTFAQHLAWNLGYQGQEEVTLTLESLDELREHLNVDEQMRIVESGVVYVDVRDAEDRWVRIEAKAGDVVVLPRGLYHRLVAAASSSAPVKVLRLLRKSTVFRPLPREGELDATLAAEAREARADHQFYVANPPTETVLGPANNDDNILVTTPRDFDATFDKVKAGLAQGDVVVLLFKGASDRKTHKSWCPPCVLAEPMVRRAVLAARSKRRVVYVQSIIERSVYLGNPDYAYRTHPFVGVVSIPFLVVLQQGEKGLNELLRERDPGERYESWVKNI